MIPDSQRLFPDGNFVFQHDNAPVHTAVIVKNYLQNKKLNVMVWPPQSPDLNPIENLWRLLDLRLERHHVSTCADLMIALKIAYSQVTQEVRQNLLNSMNRRCRMVLQSEGYPIDY